MITKGGVFKPGAISAAGFLLFISFALSLFISSFSTASAASAISIGAQVQTTAHLNVRSSPGGTKIAAEPSGTLGIVIGGPQKANGRTWWDITYATGDSGWSAQAYLTVVQTIPPPAPTVTLTASLSSITSGQSSTLSWNSTNATICTGSGFTATGTSGSVSVSPTATTNYSISCTGAGGSASANANVTVNSVSNPSPTVSLTASPTSITSGQSSTLSWSSTNATSCTGSGFTATGTSGSVSVSPAATTNYSITCTGAGGSANASAMVTVSGGSVGGSVPAFDHVIIVMEENHNYSEIVGSASAPYINNTLIAGGALMTNSFAVTHPSQPNYFAIYAGSTFGTADDNAHSEPDPTLYTGLKAAGKTFTGYVESAGSDSNHSPWESFPEGFTVETSIGTTFPALFSSGNYASLPTVSFVIPGVNDDMHNGTISQGDTWLQNNLSAYATWAKSHNSLLIVTWDEDDNGANQIATIFYGANVKTGQYAETINHYNVLRTVEAMYGLPAINNTASVSPITDIWTTSTGNPAPTVTLTASLASITSGQSSTLSWNSTNATSCTGSGFTATGTSGSVSVSPSATTNYSITCTGAGGSVTKATSIAVTPVSTGTNGPVTAWHYTSSSNFDSSGNYSPAVDGFNLADVNASASQLNSLPAGVEGLAWLGMCSGANSSFTSAVNAVKGNAKLYGFYLVDEPYTSSCSPANLKAESDYIHANLPGVKTFIVLDNNGSELTDPSYMNTYNPANTDIDLFGLDPYPCRSDLGGNCQDSAINLAVNAAEAAGVPQADIVPVYQAFGCTNTGGGCLEDSGGYSTLPTAAQEQQMLSTWGSLVPSPAFDYAYTWGMSDIELPLSTAPASLQAVFKAHNTSPTSAIAPQSQTASAASAPSLAALEAQLQEILKQLATLAH